MIDSDTEEEACAEVRPWIRQRTRWIKGYMQTALVHLRSPRRLVRQVGIIDALGLPAADRRHAADLPAGADHVGGDGRLVRDSASRICRC